jgi:spore photoproduct lyase
MRTIKDIKIIIHDKEDVASPMVRKFLDLEGKEFIECGENRSMDDVLETIRKDGASSKEVLVLKKYMGRMFQRCPGTPGMICCNYLLMNTGFNCLYDCAYCFLNSYLNSFGIVQFINLDLSLEELKSETARKDAVRIGTGEFSDSLMFDRITGTGEGLIRAAARFENLFLELKTKSDNVGHLLSIPDKGNAVLAWSLNTERNVALHESGTAGLEQRIRAAAEACGAGYLVAFHFDPIIFYNGWRDEYRGVVDRLFSAVDPDRIAWISLGCFRHSPGFTEKEPSAYPGQRMTAAEMFPGPDGKYRYLKKARVEAYSEMLGRIRSHADSVFVYLCMESEAVWREVFNAEYGSSECLESAFCAHLRRYF